MNVSRDSDFCGAAVAVGVGTYDEPLETHGLAHFCEHMLALGSEKYPNESIYKSLVGKGGGKTNAFTANEATCYQFVIMVKWIKYMSCIKNSDRSYLFL